VKRISNLRVLFGSQGKLYAARRRQILCSKDSGKTWEKAATLELRWPFSWATYFRPFHRLTRTDVFRLHVMGDKVVALTKGGVYAGSLSEGKLRLSFKVEKGSRPISLASSPQGEFFFGEYHSNDDRGPMRVFGSSDLKSWRVAHEFPAKAIRHIHGIFHDSYEDCFWVLTGDFGEEAGILRASNDFSDVKWIKRGTQSVRAVGLVCTQEGLLWASDSEIEANAIFSMDRQGNEIKHLVKIESSSFHSGQFGKWTFFSTVCEPSKENDSRVSHVWVSKDHKKWKKFGEFPKDRLPFIFQYGNIFFPEGDTKALTEMIFSGTAVQKADNASFFVPLEEIDHWWESTNV